ncbi:MAG: NOG1 family protein [Methanomethylovorans sp.]|uniref:NOG1 family protein n=1 Tax=Methanomethylovorans sp. TaxID=2758717 RepID=UPI000AA29DBF|nr:NOG1 family protein [Methanomethylovorans sp.]
MIFEKIPTIRTSDELLDKAFKRGVRAASGKKSSSRASFLESQESMLLTSANILTDNLANISKKFPNFDELPDFYYELTDILIGVDRLRTSLSRVAWTSEKIHDLTREYLGKMRGSPTPENLRKQCFGRIGSLMGSIDKDLLFLNEARNILRKLPDVHEEPTIVVAGYPNTGKSSFVTAATKATPEVAPYPFTTKGISIGHFSIAGQRYQVVDTPGLLDRPMSKRNDIELQAITALKYLDAVVLFLIDASESCGYTIEEQKNLLQEVRGQFDVPILVVFSKSDLPYSQDLGLTDICMSMATGEGIEEVLSVLVEMVAGKKDDSIGVQT